MSNTGGTNAVHDALPQVIVPVLPEWLLKAATGAIRPTGAQIANGQHQPPLLTFRERMYGPGSMLDINFELDSWTETLHRGTMNIVGNISVNNINYNIVKGEATMRPFRGYFTSGVFFSYLLLLEPIGARSGNSRLSVLYGEKTIEPTFNPWRLWLNVSTQHSTIFNIDSKPISVNQPLSLTPVDSIILAISVWQYLGDQVFGIRTRSWKLIGYAFLWLLLLLSTILIIWINVCGRECLNRITSLAGSFQSWTSTYRNWDHSIRIPLRSQDHFCTPCTVEELNAMLNRVRGSGASIRMVGSGHSFNPELLLPSRSSEVANGNGYMLELSNMRRILRLDLSKKVVEVEGGVQLRRLVEVLHDHGLTLPNHGAYLVQTVAGALSTGTHGTSGNWSQDNSDIKTGTQPLINCIVEAELMDENGTLHLLREDELVKLVTLGLAGAVVRVCIRCETVNYLQCNQTWLSHQDILASLGENLQQYKLVEVRGPTGSTRAALYCYSPLPAISTWMLPYNFIVRYCLMLSYDAVRHHMPAWIYRLSYAVMTRFFSLFPIRDVNSWCITKDYAPPHLESEWSIPYEETAKAANLLFDLLKQPEYMQLVGEFHIRFDLATKPWIAPSYGRRNTYIDLNFPRSNDMTVVVDLMRKWQIVLLGSDIPNCRPHWSKWYHLPLERAVADAYPDIANFRTWLRSISPTGLFSNNPFASSNLFINR